jgi:hypothetical protein
VGSKVGGKVTVEVKNGVLLIIGKGVVPVVDNVLVIMGVFTGLHDANVMQIRTLSIAFLILLVILKCFQRKPPNGLRYLRWGGDGGAVQLEKW